MQVGDFVGDDNAAAAAEHLDVGAAALAQQVDHIYEMFDVPALVAGDGDALHVLGQGRGDDLVNRAVVPQVHDLGAVRLQDAAHDVDRGVMAVEQRCGGHEAHFIGQLGLLRQVELGGGSDVVHGVP